MKDSHYTVRGRLETYSPSFTKAEQKAAQVILAEPERVMYASVTELAQLAGVGEATILRLCRKIGYKGYQELKIGLAKESEESAASCGTAEHVLQEAAASMDRTAGFLDQDTLSRAKEAIEKAECVHLFGMGVSGVSAAAAQNRFWQTGKRAYAASDYHMYEMLARVIQKGDVVIVICADDKAPDIMEMVQQAKDKGAVLILLTPYAASPVTAYADYVFIANGGDDFFHLYMSQLFIVECLVQA
ncbi:MurR/RpiR family transcriptional regulator [Ectobacillus ponti]|uniref:MurR/RpiR family transcriptional regulator n=1 Tax=Ectobacillus ponti TaxID=2961894 RepID=A0AA41X4R8_9BACI|nr:MurR/RpiR family transcriptional regulator [Ectobacillus ponti]MCP8968692.1 MurR/RpiR family transcriptional regulator [Ectobacillus ponti]